MAVLLRNTHRLLTVRVRLRPVRSNPILTFTSYWGAEELEQLSLSAAEAGIRPELSVRNYQAAHFQVPSEMVEALANPLRARAQPGEPAWLQVESSSGHLAVVPWESIFQPALGRPLLRVPNFLADPVFLTGPLRLALVVSSPRAKTPFPVAGYARTLVHTVQQAIPRGTDIHLFADQAAWYELRELSAPPHHSLTVHDPGDAGGYGTGGTELPHSWSEARLESPWLRWIRGATRSLTLDMVHFVCPGYFRADQGALALARSPIENDDRNWSHFVGSGELTAFLDLVGAWTVAFSPPYENVWAIGLRLLADRLVWQRPGPTLLHDTEHGSPDDLGAAYRFLFAPDDQLPPASPSLMLYSHPRRMRRYRDEVAAFESGERLGYGGAPGTELPEQLVYLATKPDRESTAASLEEEPAWKRAARIQLDQSLLRLGKVDTPERRGALDALHQIENILRSQG